MTGTIRPTLHGSQLRGAKLTLEEKAALAQKYGYKGLDFSLAEVRSAGSPDAVKSTLSKHGLEASTVGGVFGGRLTDADAEFDTALGAIAANAREATAVGGTRTGTVLPCRLDRPKEEVWPLVVRRIKEVDKALDES